MNLSYRKIDYQNDVEEIINLLTLSLSDRQTSSFFLWKHFQNPFGKSYGLLAIDQEKIVGVRMFMFWEFSKNGEILRAIRPVDTITHPDYRGKGIFKSLTLQGLNDCKKDYDIIFNTPNENSYPGYIKMGWIDLPFKLNFKIAVTNPFYRFSGEIMKQDLSQISISKNTNNTSWSTNHTEDFFKWRYQDIDYNIVLFKENGDELLLVYRLKKLKGLKTIVIVDAVGETSIKKHAVLRLGQMEKAPLIYYLQQQDLDLKLSFKVSNGRVVVKEDFNEVRFNLNFSIGDLEGRL